MKTIVFIDGVRYIVDRIGDEIVVWNTETREMVKYKKGEMNYFVWLTRLTHNGKV